MHTHTLYTHISTEKLLVWASGGFGGPRGARPSGAAPAPVGGGGSLVYIYIYICLLVFPRVYKAF